MDILDDLRAEWIEMRKNLSRHIADLEAGHRVHPIDQDPDEATARLLEQLKRHRAQVEEWLVHLPAGTE